jgi:hypothetical protein
MYIGGTGIHFAFKNSISHISKVRNTMSKDPRDASRATAYKPKEIGQYEEEVDYYPLGAMLASVMGVLSKSKFWCCLSIVLAVASMATMKRSTTDYKQVFMTLMFSLFALFSAYMNPEALQQVNN